MRPERFIQPSVGLSVCPVHCCKTADRICTRFRMVGRMGPGMRQIVGFRIGPREWVILGANIGRPIVTNGDFAA